MSKHNRRVLPIRPGEILREDLMKPLELTITGLGLELKVPGWDYYDFHPKEVIVKKGSTEPESEE